MNNELLHVLGAERGATSDITLREATGDRSVTLDRYEREVLQCFYPEMNFPKRGGVDDNHVNEEFQFYVHQYNDLENSSLQLMSIVYPKKDKNELRLYFRERSGFIIGSGTFRDNNSNGIEVYWYIFQKRGERFPHIGMADSHYLNGYLSQVGNNLLDVDDLGYQTALQNELAGHRVAISTFRFQRSVREATEALQRADFRCEANQSHETFISQSSGNPYVEGHHLIPLSYQGNFTHSIDIKENIVSLCPNCHRLLHYGTAENKREILLEFLRDRQHSLFQKRIEIDEETLLSYYLF